jgi:Fic family protein
MARRSNTSQPAGYTALVERYHLSVIPNWHRSYVAASGIHRVESSGSGVEETYVRKYQPGDSLGDHLEFALKYDGTNLAILWAIFQVASKLELEEYVSTKSTGKYARRIWYLYELLTGNRLSLDDLTMATYVDLIDPEQYYTAQPARQVRRQRVNDNLPGGVRFCPMIRKTDSLRAYEAADLPERCRRTVGGYSPDQLRRALSYLYTKETQSSFEIERIKPSAKHAERFIALLESAEEDDYCEKTRLIGLQNQIVDPRFRELDYRTSQNYVGQAVGWRHERVHYVCPKPEDIAEMMEGLIDAHRRMGQGVSSAVAHAAAIAYGFVFLHPFEDGNGRIHRFLIHNILARRRFTPENIMFPVSAAMLNNLAEYDASLEAFSRPLLALVDYSLDKQGRMTVHDDTAAWYRYIDLTAQAEALFRFIERTIETELVNELTFLANYDNAKEAIQEIVDMPDRQVDLFIMCCHQNNSRLSSNKRSALFDFLSDDEVARMEQAMQTAFATKSPPGQRSEGD